MTRRPVCDKGSSYSQWVQASGSMKSMRSRWLSLFLNLRAMRRWSSMSVDRFSAAVAGAGGVKVEND